MISFFFCQLPTGDWRLPTAYFFTFRLSPNTFNDLNKKNLLLKKQEISQ
jgi:hypothetical protein